MSTTDDLLDLQDRGEPSSTAEAHQIRNGLIERKAAIESQLGGSSRFDESGGYRVGYVEYEEWRRRAKGALRHVSAELRRVNTWIRTQNVNGPAVEQAFSEISVSQIVTLIRSLTNELARRTASGGIES